ncbi:protein FAR1-RELATED SEQUENCE 5-like [Lotus japonicus]|uniref:protein FAR1-RELATED SEQUENCE 5-like n=1 Tax=Lotus japonicus TaxID=34305 RepID=UPI00258DFDD8|nr:protein FAR1-RELATED SEQUENCE 5-like [Lotus japonicus]
MATGEGERKIDNAEDFLQENEDSDSDEENETSGSEEIEDFCDGEDVVQSIGETCTIPIDSVEDMGNINFVTLTFEDMKKYRFLNRNVAYDFYNMYARFNGFSTRRSVVKKNFKGEIVQQNFVCHKQGHREDRFGGDGVRKREPRRDIRCGCLAHCKVHIDESEYGQRWVVKHLDDGHSHLVVPGKHVGLLAGHRKMCDMDVSQMNNMIGVGISPPQVYASFAGEAGGYLNVNFNQRNMYNVLDKERINQLPDARGAFGYLRTLRSTDPDMYWSHKKSEEGKLLNLFWCDGQSRRDYGVFGDVLAFDATYRKNKYSCPLVVLSGVNHHNRTIVFGTAIVSDEKEETYVWLLEKFVDAMKGKALVSVITDGCKSMRNAIRRVFPDAHHRLCAWHLLENAGRNVKKPKFVEMFKRCMLGDYEVAGFEDRWEKMVIEFEVQDEPWVKETYEKKEMWASAYMRGQFFGGFRTTSRVEGLHAQLSRYVNYKNNLCNFLKNFHRCMTYFRFKEVEDDFNSTHGEQVLLTSLKALERAILQRASTWRVFGFKRTAMCVIYFVKHYPSTGRNWQVTYYEPTSELKCSCERMESVGLPCDHIVSVMVHIDMVEIPKSLVLGRWTINAKESIEGFGETEMNEWDQLTVDVTAGDGAADHGATVDEGQGEEGEERHIRNPDVVRSKGCGAIISQRSMKGKRTLRCGICGKPGHNRTTCTRRDGQTSTQLGTQQGTQEGSIGVGLTQRLFEEENENV